MKLNREECISELDTKIKYAKFANTDFVVLSSKAAQFCLEHAQYYEQKIKELTEENERLRSEVSVKKKLLDKSVDIEDKAKADTVRKMQERLLKELRTGNIIMDKSIADIVDQIAKEMLMEDNNND